jgi:feruloyl-CoA synthase
MSPADDQGLLANEKPRAAPPAGGWLRRIGRFVVMTEPPSVDGAEITDKGYVNQRATLERQANLVTALYANPPGQGLVVV